MSPKKDAQILDLKKAHLLLEGFLRNREAEIELLRAALAFYADANNYASGDTHVRGMTRPVMQDYGRKATAALSGSAVGSPTGVRT